MGSACIGSIWLRGAQLSPVIFPQAGGLLHELDGRVREIVRPTGNLWAPTGVDGEWRAFQHAVNAEAERAVLFSIARRLAASGK